MSKVTMQDIADELKLSKCMVSLALSDRYGVNSDTKAQIISAAVKMGYDFSRLRKKRKTDKAVTVLIRSEDLTSKRYWPQVFRGVVKRGKELDFMLYTEVIEPDTDFEQLLIRISEHCTNGIIVLNYISDELLDQVRRLKLPIVLVDSKNISGSAFDQVRVNNSAGGYEATRLLLGMGHRNICFIGNKNYSVSFNERYQGFHEAVAVFREEINAHSVSDYGGRLDFVEALAEFGIKADESLRREELFDVGEVARLLKRNARGITAFICANDVAAELVHRMCRQFGHRVPEDVSIVGFDNIYLCGNDWINTELTSVTVPIKQMGERAVSLLAERIVCDDNIRETILLAVQVAEKKSVKNLLKGESE